jgi:putative oxygen-independent coproporphyrinogen III oxidase
MNLGIYIQVPFCQTKCTYCNFHTGVFAKSLYGPYVRAVCREIATYSSACAPDKSANDSAVLVSAGPWIVDTVYLGGGTPSLLEPHALADVLRSLRDAFVCSLEEVTLEADPETITPEKAAAWRAAGFNRISLGAQSFDDRELAAAGRLHRRGDISNAVRWLREAALGNISLDLIAGLPHQSAESWENSLENLSRLRPEHVSIYMMEIDEGSRLGREALTGGRRYSAGALPDDDSMAAFYERACALLAREGYEHYEISNWALPGFASKHNLKYWRREPYLGFGAGAHSFDGKTRWANAHDPAAYVAAIEHGLSPKEQIEPVTEEAALEEELFLGLRQLAGIDLARIEAQYNVRLGPRLEPLRDAGLIEIEGSRLRLAPSRLTISNEVFVELMR